MGNQIIPRIMIVESYGTNLKSISGHLESSQIPLQVLAATDAKTAMAQLQRESVDLVTIAASLRGKTDGYDLCRAIRSSQSNQDLPVILLLSGYLSLERSKAMSAGADLLLHKPVVKEELFKMIQVLLAWRVHQVRISDMTAQKRVHSLAYPNRSKKNQPNWPAG